MKQIATDDDRKLADYIRKVRAACSVHPDGRDTLVFDCMATVLVEYRNGMDPKKLGQEIAEHG